MPASCAAARSSFTGVAIENSGALVFVLAFFVFFFALEVFGSSALAFRSSALAFRSATRSTFSAMAFSRAARSAATLALYSSVAGLCMARRMGDQPGLPPLAALALRATTAFAGDDAVLVTASASAASSAAT